MSDGFKVKGFRTNVEIIMGGEQSNRFTADKNCELTLMDAGVLMVRKSGKWLVPFSQIQRVELE